MSCIYFKLPCSGLVDVKRTPAKSVHQQGEDLGLGLGLLFVFIGVLQSTVCTVRGIAVACLGGVTSIGGNVAKILSSLVCTLR